MEGLGVEIVRGVQVEMGHHASAQEAAAAAAEAWKIAHPLGVNSARGEGSVNVGADEDAAAAAAVAAAAVPDAAGAENAGNAVGIAVAVVAPENAPAVADAGNAAALGAVAVGVAAGALGDFED